MRKLLVETRLAKSQWLEPGADYNAKWIRLFGFRNNQELGTDNLTPPVVLSSETTS